MKTRGLIAGLLVGLLSSTAMGTPLHGSMRDSTGSTLDRTVTITPLDGLRGFFGTNLVPPVEFSIKSAGGIFDTNLDAIGNYRITYSGLPNAQIIFWPADASVTNLADSRLQRGGITAVFELVKGYLVSGTNVTVTSANGTNTIAVPTSPKFANVQVGGDLGVTNDIILRDQGNNTEGYWKIHSDGNGLWFTNNQTGGWLLLTSGGTLTMSDHLLDSAENLTNLNASALALGTVPDGRFPATLPAASGVNLTALNANQLSSGTVLDARLSSNVPLKNGNNNFTGSTNYAANLTALIGNMVPVFNVKQYGAVGDGVTDDSTAILRATQAWTNSGGILFYPVGSYVDHNSGYDMPTPLKRIDLNYGSPFRIVGEVAGSVKVTTTAATYFRCTNGPMVALDSMIYQSGNGIAASNVFCFNMYGTQNIMWRNSKLVQYGLGAFICSTVVNLENCTATACYNGFQFAGFADEARGSISVGGCTNGLIIGGNNIYNTSRHTVEQANFVVDGGAMYDVVCVSAQLLDVSIGSEATLGANVYVGDTGKLPGSNNRFDGNSMIIVRGCFTQNGGTQPIVMMNTNASSVFITGEATGNANPVVKFLTWFAASNTTVAVHGISGNIVMPDGTTSSTVNIGNLVLWNKDFTIFNASPANSSPATPRFRYDYANDRIVANSTDFTLSASEVDFSGFVKTDAYFKQSSAGDHVWGFAGAGGNSWLGISSSHEGSVSEWLLGGIAGNATSQVADIAIREDGYIAARVKLGIAGTSGATWSSGSGSPEGAVTAPVGSLYSNTAGGTSTTLYVKTSGSGNTGWTAK